MDEYMDDVIHGMQRDIKTSVTDYFEYIKAFNREYIPEILEHEITLAFHATEKPTHVSDMVWTTYRHIVLDGIMIGVDMCYDQLRECDMEDTSYIVSEILSSVYGRVAQLFNEPKENFTPQSNAEYQGTTF